jgi:hypothetical protein
MYNSAFEYKPHSLLKFFQLLANLSVAIFRVKVKLHEKWNNFYLFVELFSGNVL